MRICNNCGAQSIGEVCVTCGRSDTIVNARVSKITVEYIVGDFVPTDNITGMRKSHTLDKSGTIANIASEITDSVVTASTIGAMSGIRGATVRRDIGYEVNYKHLGGFLFGLTAFSIIGALLSIFLLMSTFLEESYGVLMLPAYVLLIAMTVTQVIFVVQVFSRNKYFMRTYQIHQLITVAWLLLLVIARMLVDGVEVLLVTIPAGLAVALFLFSTTVYFIKSIRVKAYFNDSKDYLYYGLFIPKSVFIDSDSERT